MNQIESWSTPDAAFVDYGIPRGSGLASATYSRLVETGAGVARRDDRRG